MEELVNDLKRYVNLRVDELKYKSARSVSSALARVLSFFLIIVVFAIVLGLLAYALLQWLNAVVGAPWGTLIVAGGYTVLLAVLWRFRKKMFYHTFSNILLGEDPRDIDDEIESISADIRAQESMIGRKVQGTKERFKPSNLISTGLQSDTAKTLALSVASWAVSSIIKCTKRKKK